MLGQVQQAGMPQTKKFNKKDRDEPGLFENPIA
ncbi:hypothetical protein M2360_001140 [Rhizobium sp. SG_E_25_P2]|jgi:hypothetical protein|nr:hypothetical protein [Rhizobium sp. SG_E_25_P2]